MSFISDFKSFLMKGDIVSLATAVVIGLAFQAIVDSFVEDIIMPLVGLFTGGIDFTQKFISLGGNYDTLAEAEEAGVAVITYGNLIQAAINFLIVGLFIFLVIRAYDKTKKAEEEAAPAGPTTEDLLIEIRDELKKRN